MQNTANIYGVMPKLTYTTQRQSFSEGVEEKAGEVAFPIQEEGVGGTAAATI